MRAAGASADDGSGRPGFAVIPVLDLRGGRVVRARRGERSSYAPIETPLAKGSAPDAVARGLLDAWPARILYLADLDAIIDGAAPDLRALEEVAAACPGIGLWVDAGFTGPSSVDAFLATGLGRPVIGSESQSDAGLVARLGDRAVFSLDTRGATRLGPAALHDDPALWPSEVIAMTLAQVGAGAGPDLDALAALRARASDRRIYAAGGVRGPGDLRALRAAGIAGALVASALHDGTLSRADAAHLA
jgi:phosphoribosyl isomerase A